MTARRRACCPTWRWSSSAATSYAEIADHLWIFAILGTVLAMLQLLVYSVLARQGQRSVYLVWAALVR